MLAQGTSSHQLLFQMSLPAETTVLMFGGYEQIPTRILCYELCFWKWKWNLVFLWPIASKVQLIPFSKDLGIKEKFERERGACFSHLVVRRWMSTKTETEMICPFFSVSY